MNIALLLSGGTGTRVGAGIPKQYIEVEGRPILAYALQTLEKSPLIDRIYITAVPQWQERIRPWTGPKFAGFSVPGATRQLSIWNALQDIQKDASPEDRLIIHDGARPFLTDCMIKALCQALDCHDGALPILPMKDTVYIEQDGSVASLLDRSHVVAGQAPEGFLLGKYTEANRRLLPEQIRSINGSTEPAILAGMDVACIPGDERNFKITTKADLERFRQMVSGQGASQRLS